MVVFKDRSLVFFKEKVIVWIMFFMNNRFEFDEVFFRFDNFAVLRDCFKEGGILLKEVMGGCKSYGLGFKGFFVCL